MAVSENTLEHRRSWRLVRPGRKALAFVLAVLVGIGLVVGGLAYLHEQYTNRILPGISVAGVDVGGMTADEARQALETRLADLSQGGLLVRTGLGATTINFADVGRTPDVDGMLAQALNRGRGGTWLDETIAGIHLRLDPQSVPLRLGYDHERAAAAIHAFAARMELSAIDASIRTTSSGFAVVPGSDGSRIDEAAAIAAVDQAMADPATKAGSVVTAPAARVTPTLTTETATAASQAALRIARDLTITSGANKWKIYGGRIRTWLTFAWSDGTYGARIDTSKIAPFLDPFAKKVARPVLDAAYLRDKHGRIVGSMADRAGRALDVEKTVARIVAALQARAAGSDAPASVALAVATVAPRVTTGQVVQHAPLMSMLGGWTTYYQVAAHNGFGANITVPTRTLNGTVVAPGQVFDFWQSLGEVSFRTGYRLGGAIVGGHSVEGKALAGGICAASTTLFNAALRSGYEILTRQPHWYYITRYPLGLDATVSGSQTMRFRNDTPYPLLIRGFASPGIVRFEIWSVPSGRTVSLSRPSVSNVVPGADSVVKTTALPAGTSERTEWPVDGKDVVVTRTVRDANGHVIHFDTFVSHYHRMIGILRIGIG